MSKRILITGATGTIGQSLIKQLKASNVDFIAGSRDYEKAKSVLPISEEEWVKFDYTDEKTFDKATKNVEKVFVLGPPRTFDLEDILILFTDFLKQKGIERVVYLSAFGNKSLVSAQHAVL